MVVRTAVGCLHVAQMDVLSVVSTPLIEKAQAVLVGLNLGQTLGLLRIEMKLIVLILFPCLMAHLYPYMRMVLG